MRRTSGPALVVILLLAGCGGDDGDAEQTAASEGTEPAGPAEAFAEAPEGGASGDAYEGELDDGSHLRVRLDVDADDPAVAPFEAFREMVGGPPVTWLVAEIEVPDGTDGTGRFVTLVEAGLDPLDDDPLDDGDGITNAEFVCSQLDDWAEGAADAAAASDAYLELLEGPCSGQSLQVLAPGGETTTYVMVYEGELPDFERLQAGLGTELEPA